MKVGSARVDDGKPCKPLSGRPSQDWKIGMLRRYRYRTRARRFHAQQLLLPAVATDGDRP